MLNLAFTDISPSNSAHADTLCLVGILPLLNAKRDRQLQREQRKGKSIIQKRNAEYGRREHSPINVSGVNTDAGIEMSSVRMTSTKKISDIMNGLNRDASLGTI